MGSNFSNFGASSFNYKPKAEHIERVVAVLSGQGLMSPKEIVKETGLSLTSVRCALAQLEDEGKIEVIVQKVTPKIQVRLKSPVSMKSEVMAASQPRAEH